MWDVEKKTAVWENAPSKWFVCCSDIWFFGFLWLIYWLFGWLVIFLLGCRFGGLIGWLPGWWDWWIQDVSRKKTSWIPLDPIGSNIFVFRAGHKSGGPVPVHDHWWIHEPLPAVWMSAAWLYWWHTWLDSAGQNVQHGWTGNHISWLSFGFGRPSWSRLRWFRIFTASFCISNPTWTRMFYIHHGKTLFFCLHVV